MTIATAPCPTCGLATPDGTCPDCDPVELAAILAERPAPAPHVGRRFRFRFWNIEHDLICRDAETYGGQTWLSFVGLDGSAHATFRVSLTRCTPLEEDQ
jgi:hypothetical protein